MVDKFIFKRKSEDTQATVLSDALFLTADPFNSPNIRVTPSSLIQQAPTLFTDKVIINEEPLCVKEIRYVENLETTVNIENGTANYVGFKAIDSLSANQVWSLPASDGSAGDLLSTDGSGTLSFISNTASDDVNSALEFTTDHAVLRVDLPNGTRHAQQSTVVLDDLGNYSQIQSISLLQDSLDNTKYGFDALASITTGVSNTAIGESLIALTEGDNNIGIGHESMTLLTTGSGNISIGQGALDKLTTTDDNISIGRNSLNNLVTGTNNICVGLAAGGTLVTNDGDNIVIGNDVMTSGDNAKLHLGHPGVTNFTVIRGVHNVTPAAGSDQMVIVDGNDRLGGQAIPVVSADTVLSTGNLTTLALTMGDGGSKNIQSTTITVANADELNNIQSINLLSNNNDNTWLGFQALNSVAAGGNDNTAVGDVALSSITTGDQCTAVGSSALRDCVANDNTAVGYFAGFFVDSGTSNTFIGSGCGGDCEESSQNTGVGVGACRISSVGTNVDNCTAIGYNSMNALNLRQNVTAVGAFSANKVINAQEVTAIGFSALRDMVNGDFNTAIGSNALLLNDGANNTAVGCDVLNGVLTATDNIALGYLAGSALTLNDSDNIFIGNVGVVGDNDKIRIGNGSHDNTFIQGIYQVTPTGSSETVIIDSTGELGSTTELELTRLDIVHTATEADDHALEIDVNAATFGDVKALDIVYVTGNITAGIDEEAILINVDQSLSTGGRIVALEVIGTSTGTAEIDGMECGVGCHPIHHQSGTFGDSDSVLVLAVDQTVALSGGGAGLISVFVADNDDMTIGLSTQFTEIEFIMDTFSSGSGISPTWEFSTGIGTWSSYTPADGTNGMRNNGVVIWELADIPSWATGTGAEYLIRVTRTRNTLSTTPIMDLVQVSATTLYTWDSSGDLSVNSVSANTLELIESGGTDKIVLQSPALAAGYTLTLPIDDGNNLDVLQSNGSGVLSWVPSTYPPNYIYNCGLAFNTTSIVNVKAGNCIDSTNVFNIDIASPLTMTMSSTGSAGGMQVAEASSTMYKIYVIADTNGINAVNTWGVPQGTAISLPATHDVFRLMGHVKNNGSSNILQFVMHNRGETRHYQYQESRLTMEVYDSVGTANVFTNQDLGLFIPEDGVSMVDLTCEIDTDNDSDIFFIQSGINPQTAANSLVVFGNGLTAAAFEFMDFMIYNQAIDPTGGTSSQPSVEWGTSVVGQDVRLAVSAYTQNL